MNACRCHGVLSTLLFLCILVLSSCAGHGVEPSGDEVGKADSLIKMGDVYLREGKYRNAMKQYLEAEQMDPHNAELKFRIGLVYGDFYGKNDEAIRYYKEAIELKDNYSEAYNNLGTVYARQEEWDLAIETYEKALDNLFYSSPEKVYYNIAAACHGKGDFQKALNNYKMAIELRPERLAPYLQLALLYREQGQNEEALQTLRKARSVIDKGKPKKSVVSEERWNAYLTDLTRIYYEEAKSLKQLERHGEAREVLQRALEVAPDDEIRELIELDLQSLPEQTIPEVE